MGKSAENVAMISVIVTIAFLVLICLLGTSSENMGGIIVAIMMVTVIVILQISSFTKTRKKILEFRTLFDEVEDLFLKETSLTPSVLRSKSSLQKFLSNIPNRHVKSDDGIDERIDYTDLSLLAISGNRQASGRFGVIVNGSITTRD